MTAFYTTQIVLLLAGLAVHFGLARWLGWIGFAIPYCIAGIVAVAIMTVGSAGSAESGLRLLILLLFAVAYGVPWLAGGFVGGVAGLVFRHLSRRGANNAWNP